MSLILYLRTLDDEILRNRVRAFLSDTLLQLKSLSNPVVTEVGVTTQKAVALWAPLRAILRGHFINLSVGCH